VHTQIGASSFRVDLGVVHPDFPGRYLAGVECDGATYHRSATARDRDKLREQVLRGLGWEILRIWSTDWFYNPRQETERLRAFLEERRRLSALDGVADEEEDLFANEPEEIKEMINDAEAAELAEEIAEASGGGDDVFVEVGDRVTYCPVDDPADRHSILIVDSESNVKMGLVNESTALAQALLGLSPGDEGVLEVPGGRARVLRVIKVQRQEELLT